ncbi:ATP-binding protein [Corallococcus praedator]|uniref:ATP-binding protein n=1 Tax=Corallococcus praedator TaxID=2316724 RepID=A0ABX9Q6F6_9BACT|nr:MULTISPECIES: AAA family ATPase [Corallococcus]RKH20294.1 ATP-binding protein [Corallococcus sp. CA031C]RKH90212.1 ATP-binding protein [Corallococcus praedator]
MEAVIFTGIQGTGKSTFFKERFFHTHVRVSLDLLKTRHREAVLLRACLGVQQPLVVDNTNPTVEERAHYLGAAKSFGFRVVGYYFQSKVADALERNARRSGEQRVPTVGVLGTYKRLQVPSPEEGFDALFFVRLSADGFIVEEWQREVR